MHLIKVESDYESKCWKVNRRQIDVTPSVGQPRDFSTLPLLQVVSDLGPRQIKSLPFTIFHKRFKVCSWDRPEKPHPHGTIAADFICSQVTTWLGSKALCWKGPAEGRRANAITSSRVCCVIRLVGYVFGRGPTHTYTHTRGGSFPSSFPRFRTSSFPCHPLTQSENSRKNPRSF